MKRIRRYRWHRYYKRRIILTSRKNTEEEIYFVQILLAEKWKEKSLSLVWHLQPHGLYSPWNSSGQNTGVDSLSFLQGIFPTQGLKPGLLHCRQILYQLSHKEKPKNTAVGSLSLLHKSFQPRNWTQVSCIGGRFFTNWAIRTELQITLLSMWFTFFFF